VSPQARRVGWIRLTPEDSASVNSAHAQVAGLLTTSIPVLNRSSYERRNGYDHAVEARGRPITDNVTAELEALKLRLAALEGPEIPAAQVEALAVEIGAIRLHLKRLALEREAVERTVDGALRRRTT